VPTCEVPVLFSAELAGGLFGSFLSAISGGSLYRKSSFLEGTLGQKLFPEWLTIDERPHLMRAMGSASFDGDGLATYAKPFVEKGELVSYILGTYSGRKLGMPSTANAGGVHNLFVTHGDEDQAALLRRMGRPAGDRIDGAGPEHGHRRLFPWRGGFLGRERRNPVRGAGSDHRRQHARHVQADRCRR
jgi:PmbA protein